MNPSSVEIKLVVNTNVFEKTPRKIAKQFTAQCLYRIDFRPVHEDIGANDAADDFLDYRFNWRWFDDNWFAVCVQISGCNWMLQYIRAIDEFNVVLVDDHWSAH